MIDDIPALSVLIARTLRELHLRDIEQKLISEANQRLAQNVAQLSNLKSAFAVFGYELTDANVWKQVRAKIGEDAYRKALREGQDAVTAAVTTLTTTTNSGWSYRTTITHQREQLSRPEPASADQADAGAEPATTDSQPGHAAEPGNVVASQETAVFEAAAEEGAGSAAKPRVRDAVLGRLKLAGERGLKASDLRQYYENAFATTLHEKTIGMTLYRLSKEELVRRDGRTWFYITPQGESSNASIESLK
jgi:hypothetical protein